MHFIFKPEHLEIKLSLKERINVILFGKIKFNRKSVYVLSSSLMKIISDMVAKYGDIKEHGAIPNTDSIKTD